MRMPRVVKRPDGQYRRAVFGLRPYIADYPEQVYLAGMVSNWCPKYVHITFDYAILLTIEVDVMRRVPTLIMEKATHVHMKRQTSGLRDLILESYGTTLGLEMI